MLARIINEFRQADGPLNLNELSRCLGVERSALEGMIELLVRQGKLLEVSLGTEACARCAGHLSCAQVGNMMGKAYIVVDQAQMQLALNPGRETGGG